MYRETPVIKIYFYIKFKITISLDYILNFTFLVVFVGKIRLLNYTIKIKKKLMRNYSRISFHNFYLKNNFKLITNNPGNKLSLFLRL